MSETTALSMLLGGVAAELTRLHERALDLQFSTGAMVEGGEQSAMTTLQDLDRMTQDLDGLAGYVASLSTRCEDTWRTDASAALASLTLASLANRLSPDAAPEPVENDDIELFDKAG